MNNVPTISIELQRSINNLISAMAHETRVRPIVKAYQAGILAQMNVGQADYPDHIITDPKDAWLMPDDDFLVYVAKCDEAAKTAGFTVDPEHCPLLMAEESTRQVKRTVLDAAKYFTKVGSDDVVDLDKRQKMVELILGFVTTAPRKKFSKLAVCNTDSETFECVHGKEFSVAKRYYRNGETHVWGHWIGGDGKNVECPDVFFDHFGAYKVEKIK